jgi:hypothetical protein
LLLADAETAKTVSRLMRKAIWTGLYAGLGALATMAARRTASLIWRRTTGEEPPTKK